MSNQTNGFQGSQPFITDKQFQNLSLDEIRHIIQEEREELKKDYNELEERRKLIKQYQKLQKAREKVRKGIDIKKERKKKVKKEIKKKKIKSFEDYFEECIKNKEIPPDTPSYLREALERAIKEHNQGLIKEKSSLENFANKYVIKGEPGLSPVDFLNKIYNTLEEFFTYHRNIKFNMLLVCLMEQQLLSKDQGVIGLNESKAYFTSGIRKNLKSTDLSELIDISYKRILGDFDAYQENGSGWYFKEVVQLEIHTVEFNPSKGSSYIPLPDWISNKKAIVNIQDKDEKCFLWCILRCLHPRERDEQRLTGLKEYENSLNTKGISFPMKLKDITKFEKLNPEIPVYADFECFTKSINTCTPNPEKSYSCNYQKHEPSGFCFYIKGIVPDKSFKPIIYTKTNDSDNVASIFVNKLSEVTKSIYNDFYRRPKPLRLNKEEQKSFDKAEICHICSTELKEDKVRDHCHFTGNYRGAAHNKCNLMCKKPRILPVIFHNLQGYDAHLFIKQLACLPGELNCIPSTEEKYISFSKRLKLGVYPYDYVSSLEKLSETQLPPKEEFYSKLNDEDISDDDYQHAINVWNTFECKTIRDYHDLYLKSDVLLLADVFENFRKTCLKHYNLDPAHYYTSPGLAWDACLKETGQKLQLLHDYDKLMMFERGIRGGISHISKRYAEANSKYMKDYNPDKESTYIQYLDGNNLYGCAMSQQLPTHGFSWMKNITKEKVMDILDKANHSMSNRGRKGYIFEVDLEYPKKLWKSHNDYPLAPEKMIVNGVEKLICHFKPRKNYVVHYRNLRQYLEMGIRLTAVHRGISFYQSSWMEPYIRKNTELRKTAANSFEKDFFKLMNNSVFGKTIENIRKRQNIILIDDRKKAAKLTSRPNFDRATIFDKNLNAVHMKKTEVYFNKPVYVGQAILDLSKTLMFDFHYNYIKKKYRDKAGRQITKFIGLRPKLYTFKIEDGSLTKKCKGVKKSVVKKRIDFENYFECLFTGEKQMRTMKIIRSENHDIYSKEINKIALSSEDDKRKVLEDKVKTLALR
ncbi:unnamed protein product [Porites evermanni]|uniref:DNA-directed DNA polymerase n=1 Tax=Porites evermanni TaxID=104178 RepID=A0ABN8QWG6_9CNID|nr:unnamed protein product [Porites evermanni]